MQRRILLLGVAVLLALPAIALAATSYVTALRYEAPDGTVFKVTADKKLASGEAAFDLRIYPVDGTQSPYGDSDRVTGAQLKLAGKVPLRMGSGLACADPGISTAYGTVIRRAKRVTATLQNGKRLRLTRSEPPKAWGLHGWVVAGIANTHSPITEVDAYDKAGKRIAYAKFGNVKGCSKRR